MDLRLIDFEKPWRHYLLNPASGDFAVIAVDRAVTPTLGASGFAQSRTVGLLRNRRKIFVAIYAEGGTPWLRCEDRVFDLSVGGLRATVKASPPFVRRFHLLRRDQTLLRLTYFHFVLSDWPDDGDILSQVVKVTATEEEKRRFVYFWTATSRREMTDTEEFQRQMERHLRS